MKCNPLRWLWGLLPLALLAWMTVLSEQPRIERDLVERTTDLLKRQNLGWASTSFTGREGVISGEAVDDGDQRKAYEVVRSTWGVRNVVDKTKLLDEEKSYVVSAAIRDGRIRLTGFAPSEAARKSIVDAAKAAFPRREVDDRLRLARGAPAQAPWMGGINFAFKQLANLSSGKTDLEGMNLSIEGEAQDFNSYRTVRTALAGAMPQGVSLKGERVTPPVVKPYAWAAKSDGKQLLLTGHVPSEKQREELVAAARKVLPSATVVDRMQTAAGEPRDWLAAALSSLARLARLEDGTAEMKDGQLTVTGLAGDAAAADEVRRMLKSDMPRTFRTAEQIKVREPKPVSPFTTSVEAGQVVVLAGYVPNEAAHKALVEAVKARLPGRRIDDRLQLAAGAPDGWTTCTQAGIAALGRLGNGRLQLSDRALTLAATTEDEALAAALPNEVRNSLNRACEPDLRIAINNEAQRKAEEERRRAAEAAAAAEAQRKAEEERRRTADAAAAAAEAQRKAEEERRRAAEVAAAAEAARKAEDERKRQEAAKATAAAAARTEAVNVCQQTLTQVAREGVINFKRASAELEPQSFATLDKLAAAAKACPKATIEVEGHTDAEGTPERNQGLSDRRARSVVDYLVRAGVDTSHLASVGYGETKPIAPNDTPANRARNRRIEFTVKAQ